MNRTLEVLYKIYKPFRITKVNKCILMRTMDGDYVIKSNPKINYKELYNYLYSRGFSYVPNITNDTRDDAVIFEYVEDLSIDKEQKAIDLINIVSLLHAKTSYFKEVTNDKYKEIYENVKNNILYIKKYYDNNFDNYIKEEYLSPSHYLFLRNYSLIYNACNYCNSKLDEWYSKVSDKNKQRVVLVHNNLQLDHFIKNENDYLISWDNYTFDSPILDLYHLYINEWKNISFIEIINKYNSNFELLEEERILLDIMISIPFKVEEDNKEIDNCRKYRELINYLSKSSKTILSS